MLFTPGHTPGFRRLLVRLPNTGTVILSGCELEDMYYATPVRGRGPGIPHAFTWRASEGLASLKKMRELAEKEGGQIFCGHDAEQYKRLKHLPEYYN